MHFSKRNALAIAAALCSALLYVGAISASAATTDSVASYKAATGDKDAAYKAATDTDPVPPLTPDQQKILEQKRQAAADSLAGTTSAANVSASSSAASTVSTSDSYALTQDQNPQKNSYYCGPASVNEALGQMGKWFTQAQLAYELGTTKDGTGWLNGYSGPVPKVMNAHQSRNNYYGNPVPGSPSSTDVSDYKVSLRFDTLVLGAPLIGDAYEVHGGSLLAGHPNPAAGTPIFHWFDIYGYTNAGGYTKYEDSVHGVSKTIISWAPNVPAYTTMSTSKIVQILGGRGYVW